MTERTKIKALMLPKWYPNRLDGAKGNCTERHVRAISAFCEAAVLSVHPDPDMRTGIYEINHSHENDSHVVRVYFKRFISGPSIIAEAVNLYRYFSAQRKGYAVLKGKSGPFALSHVHVLSRAGIFALYLKWTEGIPFLISEQWSGFLRESRAFTGFLKPRLSRWLAGKSGLITCVSESLRAGMEDHGFKGRFAVIPHVVDTDLFRPGTELQNKGRKMIVHISHLDSHQKNLPGILRSAKLLKEVRSDFELHLLGSGAEEEQHKELASRLLMRDRIFFHGYKSHDEVARTLGQSSFLLMFSNYETLPCAILEAFSCGLPVIAPGTGGIPEILNDDRGILVEKGDEKALAHAMDKMLSSYKEFNSPATRDFALRHFSPEVVGAKFLEAYMGIVNKGE